MLLNILLFSMLKNITQLLLKYNKSIWKIYISYEKLSRYCVTVKLPEHVLGMKVHMQNLFCPIIIKIDSSD